MTGLTEWGRAWGPAWGRPCFAATLVGAFVVSLLAPGAGAQTLRVPADYASIQAAVDAASHGATVLVAPGTYVENVRIDGKDITLASEFLTTGEAALIAQTVIDGGGGDSTILARLTSDLTIVGLTIQNASDGIFADKAVLELRNCIVRDTGDGLDWEGKDVVFGGVVRNCLFEENSDDAIDLDDSTWAIIENNVLRNNGDDGIEIRLHGHRAPTLDVVIRGNRIHGNGEDGIQIIGYPQVSNRTFLIERNLIYDNADAAIGLMDDADTVEDFRGAPLPDPITVLHNVLDGHSHGMTGGANVTFLHNAVLNSTVLGLKNVNGSSSVSYSGLWQNGTDVLNSNVGPGMLSSDPLLNPDYTPGEGSPYIDAGDPGCLAPDGTICDIGRYEFGAAPDLGLLIDVHALPSSGDAPLSVHFAVAVAYAPGLSIAAYEWDFGDGTQSHNPAPTHHYTSVGTFIVVLTLTDAGGETVQLTSVVDVAAPPGNDPPVAAMFATPTAGLLPLTVDFDGSASSDAQGPLAQHRWTFGDGSSATGVLASHTYVQGGTFNAKLTVTDQGGITDSVATSISVVDPALNDPPHASFTAFPPSGDAPLAVAFDASASSDAEGGPLTFAWDFGDGSSATGVQAATSYPTPGTYPVTITVTDDVGHEDGTTTVIEVRPFGTTTILEQAVVAGADDVEEQAGQLIVNSGDLELVADPEPQTVGLRFDGLAIPVDATISTAWLQFRSETATVGPCSLLLRGEATDHALPFSAAGVLPSARPLTAALAGWIPAAWNATGQAGAAQRSPELAQIVQAIIDRPDWASGNALALLITGTGTRRAGSFEGDQSGAPRLHVEYTLPCSGFSAELQALTSSGCAPLSVSFRDLSAGDEITSWAWDFGDGGTSSEQHPVHAYTAAGSYSVSLTVTNADCVDTATEVALVEVVAPLAPDFEAAPRTGFAPLAVDFADLTTGAGITSWAWDFGDGGSSRQPSPTHVYTSPGAYSVTLVVSNACGQAQHTLVDLVNVQATPPPVLAGLSPGQGPAFGGQVVTLNGEHLLGSSVRFDGALATVGANTVTQVVVTAPPGAAGPVDVTLTTPAGSATLTDGFTYTSLITELSPATPLAHGELSRAISASADDVEERGASSVSLTSSDLELGVDGLTVQTVGLRFTGVDIPSGATILRAAIQFQTDEADAGAATLSVRGQAADDAPPFTATSFDVSSRPSTAASTGWSPPAWDTPGAAGPAQRTPDLAAIVQELVDRPSWSRGNAMVFVVTGDGTRTAEAFDGDAAGAPRLEVEYSLAAD